MNFVACGEDCRFQVDGYCTKSELSCSADTAASKCRYFEQR